MTDAPATVLVVDDSPENRYAIRRYLEEGSKIARDITARYAN